MVYWYIVEIAFCVLYVDYYGIIILKGGGGGNVTSMSGLMFCIFVGISIIVLSDDVM